MCVKVNGIKGFGRSSISRFVFFTFSLKYDYLKSKRSTVNVGVTRVSSKCLFLNMFVFSSSFIFMLIFMPILSFYFSYLFFGTFITKLFGIAFFNFHAFNYYHNKKISEGSTKSIISMVTAFFYFMTFPPLGFIKEYTL